MISINTVFYRSNEKNIAPVSDSIAQTENSMVWNFIKERNKPIKLNSNIRKDYKTNLILTEVRKYMDIGDLDQARVACKKAILADSTNGECYFFSAKINALSNRDIEAISDYTKTVQLNPRHYQAYLNRGILRLKIKKTAAAWYDFFSAIKIKPLKTLSFLLSYAVRSVF